MAYATQAQLIDHCGELELIQLTDREAGAVLDTGVLETARAGVESLMDGYIGRRYAVPVSPVPDLLVWICCALTRHRLWKDAADPKVTADAKLAEERLAAISKGVIDLPGCAWAVQPAAEQAHIEMTNGGDALWSRGRGGFL
jgi:phage gp36-like protein